MFNDWVPKKLEIEFQVPDGPEIPFEAFRSANKGEPLADEKAFPEDASAEEEVEPELNQGQLNLVI